ncbi:hypothetical protein [Streptomyces sp. NPDC002044]|uniref:hypothetical protein n=1 Tax=Streptomyces sp. NPDC002044 TaxID=3154662 RepID=UPI003333D588
MTTIVRLWEDFVLPVGDALHCADGYSCAVALDPGAPGGVRVGAPFDLDDLLRRDPSWVSSVDGLTAVDLGSGGLLWGGEGSHGSEGFIARLTADRALVWAMFFAESNPFDRIRLSRNTATATATFTSTAGYAITVNADDPRTPPPGLRRHPRPWTAAGCCTETVTEQGDRAK